MRDRKFFYTAMIAIIMGLFSGQNAWADYIDQDLSTGKIRIHYPNPAPAACEAIVLGVGTQMARDDYDKLSQALNAYGYIVVIMDHNPGNMVKTDAAKFENCLLDVQANLLNWLSGTSCTAISHWLVGGHSAGGQAAQETISGDPTLADAIFSIDPYNCSNTGTVVLPALYWGFDVTTCFVTKEDAAEAGYYGSLGQRVFQRVDRKYTWGPCGPAPKFFHCSFADEHCLACTNCMYTKSYFFTDVANSVYKFINAAFYGTWSKSALQIDNPTTPIDLFVDNDQP